MTRRSTEETNGATEAQAPAILPLPSAQPSPAAVVSPVATPVPFPIPAAAVQRPQAPSAPHSARAQQADAVDRDSRLRERKESLKALPKGVPITDVAIIIGMKTKQGRQEVIHDIGRDFRITQCHHVVEEKVRPVTEEGQFLGMEPTGEYVLTLKVKYYQE